MSDAAAAYDPGQSYLRSRLVERRNRLQALADTNLREVNGLIGRVDAALERLERGRYGICDACHLEVEEERLVADPTITVCLGCLSDSQVRDLERDLETAAAVQTAMLPAERIDSHGWQIARHYLPHGAVSGDHCDVLLPCRDGGPAHVLLGDVSGKGVAASLLMAHLQAIFRTLSSGTVPLAEMVERANGLLCQSTLANTYATLVVARLHESGRVELCNAGHCEPILVRDGRPTRIDSTGVPLGVFCDSRYRSTTYELGRDDLLFLYSDGITEARDRGGDTYGIGRLEETFGTGSFASPEAALAAGLERLDRFRDRVPLDDDLTLMAVRRSP